MVHVQLTPTYTCVCVVHGMLAPARDEVVFLSINNLSVQFVGVPRMRRTAMDDIVFKECWSIYMGTASRVCKEWIGTSFVDVFKKRREVVEPAVIHTRLM